MDEINKNLENLSPEVIISNLEKFELSYSEIEELALSFEKDEDKIAILKYTFAPIKIIRTLKSEDSVLQAIRELENDHLKTMVALRFLKEDKNRLKAIKEIKDTDKALFIKILLSREGFKKYFLREDNKKKYNKIGLNKDITIGLEIETIGKNSEKILEAGENNGIITHKDKDFQCGKIVKRRK